MRCKHCERHCAKRRRGLCAACYYNKPGVRILYASARDNDATKPRCLHCRIRCGRRCGLRGLCIPCHKDPAIRILFSTKQPPLPLEDQPGGTGWQQDPNPTSALPGSPEKVEVLIRRASRGYNLFHQLDARIPDDVMPNVIPFPESPRHVAEAV